VPVCDVILQRAEDAIATENLPMEVPYKEFLGGLDCVSHLRTELISEANDLVDTLKDVYINQNMLPNLQDDITRVITDLKEVIDDVPGLIEAARDAKASGTPSGYAP